MTVRVLDGDRLAPREVGRALLEDGGFLIYPSVDPELCARAVKAAHEFFALPADTKVACAIERSKHFRGWSEMHNERDWREQMHFGRELPEKLDELPFLRLQGPNQWPNDDDFRAIITAYLDAVARLGERVLGCAAADLGLRANPFAGVGRKGYLLLKLIGYHPQQSEQIQRAGVAPHVDFSWITLTLQDSPGLQVRAPGGEWMQIDPLPGGLWVHAGELLQVASGNAYPATPHRVINPSLDRTRVSLPLFVNPPLTGWVAPLVPVAAGNLEEESSEASHVHRVLPPGAALERFHFGEAEWRRKGRDGWCYACSPPKTA